MNVRAQPLIAVSDVLASSRWYGELLGVELLSKTHKDTHGNVYNRLLSDGELVLQLHSWDDEQHPNLRDADKAPTSHGMLLWFEVDDYDATVQRAKSLNAEIVLDSHVNSGPQHHETWLLDPDGYTVVIASTDGSAG